MTLATSIQQAACNALATWLRSQMPADVTVEPRWFEPDVELPAITAGHPKAISIVPAGKRKDNLLEPKLISKVADVDATTATYRWQVAEIVQPVQLDAWAGFDVDRDDMLARLDQALHAGLGATCGDVNCDPIEPTVTVPLGDGWQGRAEFDLGAPDTTDTPTSSGQSEFRATYSGEARAILYVDAESPRMAAITIRLRLSEHPSPTGGTDATVTTDGASFTDV